MFVIRDANPDDLVSLKRLAGVLNTVNLPDDTAALKSILDTSTRSFSGRIKAPFEREYLFVMEELSSGRLVGTSQIIAQSFSVKSWSVRTVKFRTAFSTYSSL